MRSFVMGDISQGPDIESAKRFWRAYDQAVDGKCAACWARRACNRPCPWEIATEDGGFRAPDERHCDKIRQGVEEGAYMRYYIRKEFPEIIRMLEGDDIDREHGQTPSVPQPDSAANLTG